MSCKELNLDELAQRLDAVEPPAGLWLRIERAHVVRRRRRVYLRAATAAFLMFGAFGVFLAVPHTPGATDWQARSQALEIELRAIPVSVLADDSVTREARSDLERIDGALQAAYDRGARSNELVPLWKQRTELLSTLLAVRQQSAAVTRI
jgi:hypothetical protein